MQKWSTIKIQVEEVFKFSRVLDIASVLLVIVGIMGIVYGLQDIFLLAPLEGAFNPNELDKRELTMQFGGLYMLSLGLSLCITAMLPYRKGEKWSWYMILITFGLALLGQLALVYIGANLLPAYYLPASIILVVLWIVGLILPIKEFFR